MSEKDEESECPLNQEHRNYKQRYNPKNAAVAHCFQLHDTLRTMYGAAHCNNEVAWKSIIDTMQAQLNAAKQAKFQRKKK